MTDDSEKKKSTRSETVRQQFESGTRKHPIAALKEEKESLNDRITALETDLKVDKRRIHELEETVTELKADIAELKVSQQSAHARNQRLRDILKENKVLVKQLIEDTESPASQILAKLLAAATGREYEEPTTATEKQQK